MIPFAFINQDIVLLKNLVIVMSPLKSFIYLKKVGHAAMLHITLKRNTGVAIVRVVATTPTSLFVVAGSIVVGLPPNIADIGLWFLPGDSLEESQNCCVKVAFCREQHAFFFLLFPHNNRCIKIFLMAQ